ncbi:MAG: transglutaminase N-terminal domain-containing protein, partial [Abditibacteriaceae bacterium]
MDYGAPVTNSLRLLRVFPPHRRGGQAVESLDWRCEPKESTFGVRTDDFGNQILGLSHHQISSQFIFEMELVTSTDSAVEGVTLETGLTEERLNPFLMPSALADFNGVMLPMSRALEGQPISEI